MRFGLVNAMQVELSGFVHTSPPELEVLSSIYSQSSFLSNLPLISVVVT